MNPIPCPDRQTLELFLLGELRDDAAAEICGHFSDCDDCLKAAHDIAAEDTLVDAIRSAETNGGEDHDIVEQIIARIHRLSAAADETQDSAAGGASSADDAESSILALLDPPEQPDEIGRLGGYRVLELLGAGGMGVVFLAEDPGLKREVALKVMKPTMGGGAASQRFLREAQATAAIEHDNIVGIYQVGQHRGLPFIAMQFLRGESLQARLAREGALPAEEILRIGREIAGGLSAAHAGGLLHRDIKPDNIWLEEGTGRVKIVDFGLARVNDDDVQLTQSGAIVGTPKYMAPEQAEGRPIDHRCDLFSLGSVLYRLASGSAPFQASNVMGTLMAVANEQPPPLSDSNSPLPPRVIGLISKLMQKDPEDRFQSASDVVAEIWTIEGELSEKGRDTLRGYAAPAMRRRRRPVALLAALLGLILAALAAVYVIRVNTGEGQVVIHCHDPGVEIAIRRNGEPAKTMTLTKKQTSEIIGVGEIEVIVTGSRADSYRVTQETTSLLRAGKVIVHIERRAGLVGKAKQKLREKKAPSPLADRWEPGPDENALPGLVPRPARLEGIGRWQIIGPSGINTVALSPDERLLAYSSAWRNDIGPYVISRDIQTDRVVNVWGVFNLPAILEWSPNGRTLVAASNSHSAVDNVTGAFATLCLRDGRRIALTNSQLGQRTETFDDRRFAVAWSPDGQWLALGGADGKVRTWKSDGTPGATFEGHEGHVPVVAWSPDGKSLASSGEDKSVRIWRMDRTAAVVLKDCTDVPLAIAWSPDGKRIAAAGKDKTVHVWAADGQEHREWGKHNAEVVTLAWSPNGEWLASGGMKDTVRLWTTDGDAGPVIKSAGVAINPERLCPRIHWDPLGDWLLTGSGVHFRDGTASQRFSAKGRRAYADRWTKDGHVVMVEYGGTVHRYNIHGVGGPIHTPLRHWSAPPIRWYPDGKTLALTCGDGTVRTWSYDGIPALVLKAPIFGFPTVTWSADESRIMAANRVTKVWKGDGTLVSSIKRAAQFLRWSSDGWLARVPVKGGQQQIDVEKPDGSVAFSFTVSDAKKASIHSLEWSPDAALLAWGETGGLVGVWSRETGKSTVLKKHTGGVWSSVAWSPDGNWLASGGRDRSVHLWKRDGTPGPVMDVGFGVEVVCWTHDSKWILPNCAGMWSVDGKPGPRFSRSGRAMAEIGKTFRVAGGLGKFSVHEVSLEGDTPKETDKWLGLALNDGKGVSFTPAGQLIYASPGVKEQLVYVIEHPGEILVGLSHQQFLERIGLDADRQAVQWVLDIGGKLKVAGREKPLERLDIESVEQLPTVEKIEGVDLSKTPGVVDEKLWQLAAAMTNLKSLDLRENKLKPSALRHLTELRELRSLNLSGVPLVARLPVLGSLTKLESLDVSQTNLTDSSLRDLEKLTNLKMLNVTGTKISDAGLARLRKALPDCEIRSAKDAEKKPATVVPGDRWELGPEKDALPGLVPRPAKLAGSNGGRLRRRTAGRSHSAPAGGC